jgi:hypothetical protein
VIDYEGNVGSFMLFMHIGEFLANKRLRFFLQSEECTYLGVLKPFESKTVQVCHLEVNFYPLPFHLPVKKKSVEYDYIPLFSKFYFNF